MSFIFWRKNINFRFKLLKSDQFSQRKLSKPATVGRMGGQTDHLGWGRGPKCPPSPWICQWIHYSSSQIYRTQTCCVPDEYLTLSSTLKPVKISMECKAEMTRVEKHSLNFPQFSTHDQRQKPTNVFQETWISDSSYSRLFSRPSESDILEHLQ